MAMARALVRERACALVALAANVGATTGERHAAALAACRLIARHRLLDDLDEPPPSGPTADLAPALHDMVLDDLPGLVRPRRRRRDRR